MQNKAFFEQFDAIIQSHKRIVVVSHINPDGDAIGSSLAMGFFLKKLGLDTRVIVPNEFPGFLSWMPGATDILVYEKHQEKVQEWMSSVDCIIIQDFNSLTRCGMLKEEIEKASATRILIDHHREPDMSQFAFGWSETNVSSASELVAEIVFHYGMEYVDTNIATDLLVGIMTDSGCFAHSVFHSRTFEIVGALVEKSASYNEIHRLVYDNFSEGRLRLLGYAINKMEILDDFSVAIIPLKKSELEMFDYHVGDTEGIVNYPLSIKRIKMSVLLTERQGQIRLSFRSKGDFSVHELSNKHFGGGGHTNAAGGSIMDCSMEDAVDRLKAVLPEYQHLLNE